MAWETAIVLGGLFLSGLLRGFTGFGLALAAVPLLALVLPPQQVVPVIATAQMMTAFVDLPAAWREADWRGISWILAALAAATPVGFLALAWLSADLARLLIGGLVVGSVLLLWRGVRLPEGPGRRLDLAVGVLAGLMNGAAAMPGPPIVVYFLAAARPVRQVRASFIAFFACTAPILLVPLALEGLANRETTMWALIGLPALLAGQYLGGLGFRRASAATHRRVAMASLSVLAVLLMARALAALV